MAMGLAKRAWTVRDYVCYPVNANGWRRAPGPKNAKTR